MFFVPFFNNGGINHNCLCTFCLICEQIGYRLLVLLELIDEGGDRLVAKRRRNNLVKDFVVNVGRIIRNPDFNVAQVTQIYGSFYLEENFSTSFIECLHLTSASEFKS